MFFKGLLHLPVMLKETDVVCHAVTALGHGGEDVQNSAVHLAGIGLAADGETPLKAELRADLPVHLVDLGAIAVKEVQEAGLRAGSAPAAQEFEVPQDKVQLLQVRQKILHPQRGPLAHRHQLGGLIVGVAQGGGGLVALCELGEVRHHRQQLAPEIPEPLPVNHQIRVVGDIAAGGSQVDNAGGGGSGLAIGIHMGHDVMADLPLPLGGGLVVNVGDVGFQLCHLLRGDGKP